MTSRCQLSLAHVVSGASSHPAMSAPRRRAQDLHHDAERDLRALGCHIPVINNCQSLDLAKDASSCGEGVLFMRAPPAPPLASPSPPGGCAG